MRLSRLASALLLATFVGACSESQPDSGVSPAPPTAGEEAPAVTSPEPQSALASDWLGGTGPQELPAGEADVLAVVAIGPCDCASPLGGTLPVAVRNNTAETVSGLEAVGEARDSGGELAGAGSSQGFHPDSVEPGHISIGFVFFDSPIPEDAEFAVDISSTGLTGRIDLAVAEANQAADSIVGVLEAGDVDVFGPISVVAMCFEENASVLQVVNGFAERDEVPAGGSTPFSLSLFGEPCPLFLVGGSGYDF